MKEVVDSTGLWYCIKGWGGGCVGTYSLAFANGFLARSDTRFLGADVGVLFTTFDQTCN